MMILPLNQFQKHLRLKYEYHQEAYGILEKYYGKKKFNDGRKKMAKCQEEQNLFIIHQAQLLVL